MSDSAGAPTGGLGGVLWLLILLLVLLGLGFVLSLAHSFPQQVAQATPTPLTSCPTTWDGAPCSLSNSAAPSTRPRPSTSTMPAACWGNPGS